MDFQASLKQSGPPCFPLRLAALKRLYRTRLCESTPCTLYPVFRIELSLIASMNYDTSGTGNHYFSYKWLREALHPQLGTWAFVCGRIPALTKPRPGQQLCDDQQLRDGRKAPTSISIEGHTIHEADPVQFAG